MPVTIRRFSALLALIAALAALWGGRSLLDHRADASPAAQATPLFGPIITPPPASSGAEAAAPATAAATTATPLPTATATLSATGTATRAVSPTPTSSETPTLAVSPTPTETSTPGPTPFTILTPLPTLRAGVMGVQLHPNVTEDELNTLLWLVDRLGVKWLKMQFDWSLLESQQGVLSDTFYSYRLFVQRADQQGLNVLASVVNAPGWARSVHEEAGPANDPAALGRFINLMQNEVGVDLYGNSYFEAIEVWNEPNLRREWNGGTLNGAEYMRLFDATYAGIRAGLGGHSITIVTAGLAPTGINDGQAAVDDRAYLRQMYDAGLGDAKYQNIAIGVHPYGAANPPDARCCGTRGYDDHPSWFFLNTLEDYHAIMQQYGDTGRQLWVTEFGWGTYDGFLTVEGDPAPPPADPVYFQWINEETQGNYIIRAFEVGQSLPYVGPMILWNLNFGGQAYIDTQNPQSAYALLKETINPLRPAFLMIEAAPKQ